MRHGISGTAWGLLIELDRLIFESKGKKNPIQLTNRYLEDLGISRWQKHRALRQLERAGVVRVISKGTHQNTIVQHLWFPQQD
jgi:hypothetical protein